MIHDDYSSRNIELFVTKWNDHQLQLHSSHASYICSSNYFLLEVYNTLKKECICILQSQQYSKESMYLKVIKHVKKVVYLR